MTALLAAALALAAQAQVHLDVDKQLARQEQKARAVKGSPLAQSLAAEAGLSDDDGLPLQRAVASLDGVLGGVFAAHPALAELQKLELGKNGTCALTFRGELAGLVEKLSKGKAGRYYPDLGVEPVDRLTRSLSGEYHFAPLLSKKAGPRKMGLTVHFSRVVDADKLAARYERVEPLVTTRCSMERPMHFRGQKPRSASLAKMEGRWRMVLSNCLEMKGDFCARKELRRFELEYDEAKGGFTAWKEAAPGPR